MRPPDEMTSLALVLMLLVGLSLGLLGSGGSILTVPALVYVAGIPSHQAVGMSLVIVGGTSGLGCMLNARRGTFDWRAALRFTASGIPGALLGASFTHLVSARVLLLCFGALMLAVGWRMLRAGNTGPPVRTRLPNRCLAAGLGVGLLTGFLGVGGGMFVLPALVLFAGLEMKAAVGTTLAIIALNCLAGLVGQLRYFSFDGVLTLGFLAVACLGMLVGAALTERISAHRLRLAFAWTILCLGLVVLLTNALNATAAWW